MDRSAEVLLSGPAGTGKSRACLEKLLAAAVKYPGMRALIVRQTLVSLASTALVTWREHVAREHIEAGACVYYGGSQEEPPQYRFANGSKIMIGGLDKPTKIMSSEYDLIYVQEAIELTVTGWEALSTRLRNGVMPYQQIIADTNPSSPQHWLYQRCLAGSCRLVTCVHEDNPILFDDDGRMTKRGTAYMRFLDALTGVRFLRLRKGLWVASEGVIYANWDPALHVVKRFAIPDSWPRFWSIDFGFTNPFVCQWWAKDPDGRLFMYREIYMSERIVEDHCESIAKIIYDNPRKPPGEAWTGRLKKGEVKPVGILADHDAEDRATFRKHMGMVTRPADKRVGVGIQMVDKRMQRAGDGRPRVFFLADSLVQVDDRLKRFERPTCTVEEIPGYRWATPEAKIEAGEPPKEDPFKNDDHGCDAARYMVMHEDGRQRGGMKWL